MISKITSYYESHYFTVDYGNGIEQFGWFEFVALHDDHCVEMKISKASYTSMDYYRKESRNPGLLENTYELIGVAFDALYVYFNMENVVILINNKELQFGKPKIPIEFKHKTIKC